MSGMLKISIFFTLFEDTCGKLLNYKECYEKLSSMLCHQCNLKANGPNQAAYFMANWKKSREKKE